MKKFRNVLALALVVIMMACVLCGCGLKQEDLIGTWHLELQDTEEQARILLENIDAYEEELALADLSSLKYIKVVQFNADNTYSYYCDAEGTKAFVREFFDGYFNDLFEGRDTLVEAYGGEDFPSMDQASFQQYFAEIYSCESYDALLDALADGAYNYTSLEEPSESGTYKVSSFNDMIECTEDGSSVSAGMEAVVYGDNNETLSLTYANGVEIYTKVG